MATPAFQSNEAELWPIRLGLWTNWTLGPTMGKTLTLTRQDADLLIAFTAFFIGWVGARFWRILCLVCHRMLSSKEPQDGLYHQRQVILRNSSSAEDGLWKSVQLLWHWRGAARSRLRRLLPICLMASACIAAFVTAGGYSSHYRHCAQLRSTMLYREHHHIGRVYQIYRPSFAGLEDRFLAVSL
ncbi:hypothetical protein BJ166DRAFT_51477 [Pestalotiopsis sp. NC0098]|nr:hypothetical protein BJ166DRAFT_51477 [Pestalotiopsis sp. NC0098]